MGIVESIKPVIKPLTYKFARLLGIDPDDPNDKWDVWLLTIYALRLGIGAYLYSGFEPLFANLLPVINTNPAVRATVAVAALALSVIWIEIVHPFLDGIYAWKDQRRAVADEAFQRAYGNPALKDAVTKLADVIEEKG